MKGGTEQKDTAVDSIREQRLEKRELLTLFFLFWGIVFLFFADVLRQFLPDPQEYLRYYGEGADPIRYLVLYLGILFFAAAGMAICFLPSRYRKWALAVHAGLTALLLVPTAFYYTMGYGY